MKKSETHNFVKGVERLVRPVDVTAISYFNGMNRHLPIGVQKKLMKKTAQQTPHMGFVVEPYSTFFCYPIADIDAAKQLISDDYRLIKTRIFADDEPNYFVIFGCFTAHTSAFWGSRIEMYVIAESVHTGLLTWVIVDYDTNTNSYDPARGLTPANCTDAVMTTTYKGTVLIDMQRDDGSRRFAAEVVASGATTESLDRRLWLEGNLSVDYGIDLADAPSQPFGLTFDPGEVKSALKIQSRKVTVEENSWHPGVIEKKPTRVVCFPYAQHFITDSFPTPSAVTNKKELTAEVKRLGDLRHLASFSAEPIKRKLIAGMIVSSLLTLGLLVFTIFQLFAMSA